MDSRLGLSGERKKKKREKREKEEEKRDLSEEKSVRRESTMLAIG